MKFLLVLSVFAIAFSSEAEAFFFKKAEFKGHASGDLDGLANLITLPLQIKSKIIEAKKAKINAILGALGGLSAKFSVHGGSEGHGSSGGDFGGHGSSGGDFSGSFTSGSSASSGAASSSGSSTFQGGEVYHPEPAPSAQYSQQPVIIHLYQQAPAPAPVQQVYQPAPAPVQEVYHPAPAPVQHHVQAQFQAHYEPAPAPVQQVYQPAPVQQTYQPAPAPVQQVYQPAPAPIQEVHHVSKPENTYGPPNYQPPAPISSGSGSSSYVQSVDNTYLPPHSH